MPKITHDPVSHAVLGDEQWFADIMGGMLRRTDPNGKERLFYSYDRASNHYGEEKTDRMMELYDELRGV